MGLLGHSKYHNEVRRIFVIEFRLAWSLWFVTRNERRRPIYAVTMDRSDAISSTTIRNIGEDRAQSQSADNTDQHKRSTSASRDRDRPNAYMQTVIDNLMRVMKALVETY